MATKDKHVKNDIAFRWAADGVSATVLQNTPDEVVVAEINGFMQEITRQNESNKVII